MLGKDGSQLMAIPAVSSKVLLPYILPPVKYTQISKSISNFSQSSEKKVVNQGSLLQSGTRSLSQYPWDIQEFGYMSSDASI